MALAQELCADRGGAIVMIPMSESGQAECLTTAQANDLGLSAELSEDLGQIVMPEPRDFGEIVLPE